MLLLQEIHATPRETISHKHLFFNFSPLFPCELPRLFHYVKGTQKQEMHSRKDSSTCYSAPASNRP